MAEEKRVSRILETKLTVSVGLSVNVDGDWIKTANDISTTVSYYPDEEMFIAVSKRMMSDAMIAAGDQIDLLHKKVVSGKIV